ncbi:MAG TPA: zinc metallopeptidase [Candidatus Cloacimonadota bacterium]|nr:zinc metallopeptidase [Candidatus Cloacimonadota bacterium]HPT72086.1 zinc metallopeptidase [Candidatus Cloacimonadota bacterium]
MFFWGDYTFILLIPVLILAFYAQSKVSGAYKKYSQIPNRVGMTGAEAARLILDRNGLKDVVIQPIKGTLTDNYNPRNLTLNLSEGVYNSRSLAAITIASHECGHALQHALGYAPIRVRNGIFPLANISSTLAFPLFIIGLLFASTGLMDLGILLFAGALLFHVVTLPVEYNASSRALAQLGDQIVIDPEEMAGARKVLNAAALTYVAATLMALVNLLRLIILRNERR